MGGIFSKRSSSPKPVKNCEVTQQDEAILKLKTQRDKIKQFIKRKEKCMEREKELARQLIRDGRKDRALLLLKKKRYQEKAIEQTLGQLDQIDRMVHELEFADIQQRVLEGLKQGNEALQRMNKLFDIDEIERIMDDTKEAAEYQEEITSLLSGKLSESDLNDAEEELATLLAQNEPELPLPEAPTHDLPEPEPEKAAVSEKKREKVALEAS